MDKLRELKAELRVLLHVTANAKRQLTRVRKEIEDEKRRQEDVGKPRIIWTDGTISIYDILLKVTPKRIYTRNIETGQTRQFVRETGKSIGGFGEKVIDTEAMGIS